jgi:uncharacterized protein YcnI
MFRASFFKGGKTMPYRRRLAILAALLAFAPAAEGHVVADPSEGPENGYFRTAFRVTHGCAGTATVAVTITIPPGVLSAKPQPKPGWTISMTRRPLDPPMPDGHGGKITEAVATVTWRGGPLPNDQFDEFGLSLRLPAGKAGTTLWFPAVQECERGENRWTEIPAEGQRWSDVKWPSPFVRLRGAPSGHQH